KLRVERANRRGIEGAHGNPVLRAQALSERLRGARPLATPDVDLAGHLEQAAGVLAEQRLIAGVAGGVPRAQGCGDGLNTSAGAGTNPAQKPRQRAWQVRRAHHQGALAIHEPARHAPEHAGQGDWHAHIRANRAPVAVGAAFAGRSAIDEGDGEARALELERDSRADDPGADDADPGAGVNWHRAAPVCGAGYPPPRLAAPTNRARRVGG